MARRGEDARDPHWLASKLRALAAQATLAACGLSGLCAGCTSVCDRTPIAASATSETLGRTHPEVVAEVWKLYAAGKEQGELSIDTCRSACGAEVVSCSMSVRAAPLAEAPQRRVAQIDCVFGFDERCHLKSSISLGGGGSACMYGCGRLPPNVVARLRRALHDPLARHFAEIALLEALSVDAFARLGRELLHHRAPRALRVRVERARRDELRHARAARRVLRALGHRAERGGVSGHAPRLRGGQRTLEDVARDNAVDGCVRETFGALLGTVQAARASDARMRAFFEGIVEDELAHAALAWDLHRHLLLRLSREARARVHAAQARALAELGEGDESSAELRARAGALSAAERRALAASFVAGLPFEAPVAA
jgi:hypothetical protein